ncbi:MAG: MFS transporter [Actinomycetota bacterium]
MSSQPSAVRRPPVWYLFSVTGAGILANTMITPNVPDVLADFDRSAGSAGILVGSGALPGVVMAPVIGILADRLGRKRVLLPCLVVFAVGALLAAVAPSFWAVIAGRLIQGVGGAGMINLAIVLIGDHWTGLERTRLIGRNSAVLTGLLATMPSLSGGIAELSSWRASVAVGVLAFPVAVMGWFLLPDTRPGTVRTLRDQLRAAAVEVRRPTMTVTFVAGFCLFLVIFGVFLTALPVHLEEQFGLGPGARGLLLSVPALGAVLVSFNLGPIRGVVALRPLLVATSLAIALAALGVALAPTLVLVVVALLLYGFGDGAVIPALQDVASSVPPPEQRAAVMAAWVSAVRLGQAVGPVGAALLFAATSTSVAMSVGAVIFAAVAVLFLFGPVDDAVIAEAGARHQGEA